MATSFFFRFHQTETNAKSALETADSKVPQSPDQLLLLRLVNREVSVRSLEVAELINLKKPSTTAVFLLIARGALTLLVAL